MRRRHFALLVVLLLGLGLAAVGFLLIARYAAPWGNLEWLLGKPGFLDRPRNILVVGLDRDARGARGDLFMILRLDTRIPALTVLSVPVETQTTIPGYGVGRLRDVPAVGAGPLARQTVEALLGLPVDRTVLVGPAAGLAVVEKVGGIDLLVPRTFAFRDPVTGEVVSLAAGKRRLGGKQTAAFARYRAGDSGDLKRVARQQFLACALMRQAGRNPWKLPELTRTILGAAKADLRAPEAEEIVRFVQSQPPTRFVTIPGNPGYGGAWIPNPNRIGALLERLERPRPWSGSRPPMAEIRFSQDRDKAASKLANALDDNGVVVVRTAPMDEDDASFVVAREPSGRVDHVVRSLLPAAPWILSDDPSPYSADYTLVVGRDAPDGR